LMVISLTPTSPSVATSSAPAGRSRNVRRPYSSTEHFHHPIVGDMHPEFECTSVSADEVLTLLVFPAVAGSRDADALRLLSAWQATPETSCRN
jgi:hypothetical protein